MDVLSIFPRRERSHFSFAATLNRKSIAREMSCCPPGSEKYLAADYATVGSTSTVPNSDLEYYCSGSVDTKKAVLLLPDVFGWHAGRTRNFADWFAEAGYFAVVPKVLVPCLKGGNDGDGLYPTIPFTTPEGMTEFGNYIKTITYPEVIKPRLTTLTKYLNEQGIITIHVIGFCWGGWAGTHVLADPDLQDKYASLSSPHPSIVAEEKYYGGSIEALVSRVKKPVLLFPCENDPDTYREGGAIHTILRQNLPQEGDFVVVDMPSVKHGFSIRGDISVPEVHEAVQLTLTTTLNFINAH